MKGIVSTITETKKKNFGELEQVCHNYIYYLVKYVGTKFKFFHMENNIIRKIKGKIHFGPFWVILVNSNVGNIAKLKLAHVVGFNFFIR